MAMQTSAGRYVAKIMSHKLTEAKTGTLQLAFSLEIMGKVNPEDPTELTDEGSGLQRTIFRAITDGTSKWLWETLDRLGYDKDEFVHLDEEKAAEAKTEFVSLVGKEVPVRCKQDFYNHQERESWEFDFGGNGPNLQPASQSKVREAAALYGRKKVQQKSGGAATRTTAAPAPGQDIPF